MTVQNFDDEILERMVREIKPRRQPDESLADMLAGVKFLALRRAELSGRSVITDIDSELALRIWTWWPFKYLPPPYYEEQVQEIRRLAFAGAAEGNTQNLEKAVPKATLLLSSESVHQLQMRGEVNDLLRPL